MPKLPPKDRPCSDGQGRGRARRWRDSVSKVVASAPDGGAAGDGQRSGCKAFLNAGRPLPASGRRPGEGKEKVFSGFREPGKTVQ